MEEPKADAHSNESTAIIAFWKQFDLDGKRTSWDKTCTEMREQKTASIVGRKRLNDLTKAFRAKSKEDQLIGTAELLKAYQEEIDQLSRRSKFSEAAFFGIYKLLYDAPNPVPTMEQLFNNAASGSTHALEIERLQAELNHYDEEFRRLKNQDITIRRLEDQLQEFKDNTDEQVTAEVERRMAALQAQCDERVQEALENQLSAEKRLQAAVDSVKQSQYVVDRAQEQLFEASSKYEERISRLVSENTLLAESTQRLQLALAEAEAQIQAQSRLAALSSAGTATGQTGSSSPTPLGVAGGTASQAHSMQAYEHLVTQLTEQVRVLENAVRAEKAAHEKDMREAQQTQAAAQQQLAQAHKEAAQRVSREDYDQLQRQVRLLRKVAFRKVGEDDEEEEAVDASDKSKSGNGSGNSARKLSSLPTAPECTQEDSQSLEDLLAQRIQSLDQELSRCRVALSESRQQETSLRSTVDTLRSSLEACQATIKQLEQDLEQRTSAFEGLLRTPGQNHPMQDLVSVLDPSSSSLSTHASGRQGEGAAAGASQMVPWLQAQRDKYKQQLTSMEHTCHRTQQQLEALQQRYLTLERDNVHLYSRIKYLQSTASSRGGGGGERWRDEEEGREGEVERKYEGLYESRMNPFTEFSMIEKQRKLRELSVADRIVLNTTMAIISNHTGRNILLLYLGAMHLLVFVTIYYSAHNVHHGCDPALDHAQVHAQSVI